MKSSNFTILPIAIIIYLKLIHIFYFIIFQIKILTQGILLYKLKNTVTPKLSLYSKFTVSEKIMKYNRFKFMLLLTLLMMSFSMAFTNVSAAGGTIVIGTTDSITNLDPADAYDYFSSNVLLQIGHGLMELPVTSTDAVEGAIVESSTVSADAKTFTFVLKPDLKFSDGEILDAAAVKWNLDRSMALNGDPGFLLSDVIDTVTADDLTVTIVLQIADATFLQRLTYTVAYIYSPESLSQTEIQGTPDNYPAGCGPYYIDTWTKDTEMILKPNPEYFGDDPLNDEVIIKFYTDASSLLTALESGEVDIAQKQFGPDEINAVMDNEDVTYVTKETAGIRYLILNVDVHTDVHVRRAMAAALDREPVTKTVFDDLNDPIYTMVPKIFSSSTDSFDDQDLDLVATELALAGYNATNKYVFDLSYTLTHYGDTEADVAELLKTQLEDTGFFTVTTTAYEWAAYKEGWGTLGFFLLGWWFDYPDPSNYIDPFVGAGAYSLGTNYSSTEMDGYINTMFTNTDATARSDASKDAQDLIAVDVPLIPLFSMLNQFSGLQIGVTGYNLEPSESVHYFSISDGVVQAAPIGSFGIATIVVFLSALSVRRIRRDKK